MSAANIFFILQGILVSLQYAIISIFFAAIFGIILACMQTSNKKSLVIFSNIYSSIFRGTPLLVTLSLFYFCLPMLLKTDISGFTAGVITFSLNSAAYISEIIKGGIKSIDKGQHFACKTLGITYVFKMKDIILPQALRSTLPALTNETIYLLKDTALISIIGEADIMRRATLVASEQYNYFQPLLIAACCYYFLVIFISFFAKLLGQKVDYA